MWGGVKAQTIKPVAEYNNGTLIPSTFLQTNVLSPLTTGLRSRFEVGKSFPVYTDRSIFYGGNLGVSQDPLLYGNALGKWSFMGAWQNHLGTNTTQYPGPYFVSGINYLIDYHRWGNYSASFGLKERVTDIGFYEFELPAPSAQQKIKDAVITWAYEQGTINPNKSRLIFQTIEGVDKGGYPSAHIVTEHATILHNGNFGLGTTSPMSHFDIKATGFSNNLAFTVSDINNIKKFMVDENGRIGTNTNTITADLDIHSTGLSNDIAIAVKDNTQDKKFIVTNKGKVAINPHQYYNNTYYPNLFVRGRSGFLSEPGTNPTHSIFYITTNNQNVFNIKENGDIYMPPLGVSSGLSPLYIDNNGKLSSVNNSPSSSWVVGGNTITSHSTDLKFGTTTNLNDMRFIVNNETYAKVYGKGLANNGYMELRKPVAMGGRTGFFAQANKDYALVLRGINTTQSSNYTTTGILLCESDPLNSGVFSERMKVMNLGVSIEDGQYYFSGSFAEFNLPLEMNNELRINADIVYPKTMNPAFDIGASNARVYQIFTQLKVNHVSDFRLKKNISTIESSLEKINKLRPVKYNFKVESEKTVHLGFIAQELVNIFPEVVYFPKDSSEYYAVRYAELVPVLTKAIQELNTKVETQSNTIEKMQLEINTNKSCCNGRETKKPSFGSSANTDDKIKAEAYLLQNIPNPFDGRVYIPCYIPKKEATASLRITDDNGKLVYEQAISQRGNCTIKLDDLNTTEGKYFYYLLINNAMVDAKVMLKK